MRAQAPTPVHSAGPSPPRSGSLPGRARRSSSTFAIRGGIGSRRSRRPSTRWPSAATASPWSCTASRPARAGRAGGRARLVLLVRRQPHLSEVRFAPRGGDGIVPDDLLLVETDSPFLAPQPVRGQAEPARERGRHRRALAEVRGVSYRDLEAHRGGERRERLRVVRARPPGSPRWARTSSPTPICCEAIVREAGPRPDRRRARGGWRRRRPDRAPCPGSQQAARDRGRQAAAQATGGARSGAGRRRADLGRRDAPGPRSPHSGAQQDGLQPALLDRDPAADPDDRRAAGPRDLGGDGPARNRRPAAREPGGPAYTARPASSCSSPARWRCSARWTPPYSCRGPGSARRCSGSPERARRASENDAAVVRLGFAHRRKSLPRSLELSRAGSLEPARIALEEMGKPVDTRAEALSPPEFVRFADLLARRRGHR